MRGNRKKKHAMPVELGMQRKKAYHKKSVSFQDKQVIETKQASPVLQNEISMPGSSFGPRMTSVVSANQTPSTWLKPSLNPPGPRPIPSPCLPPMRIMPHHGGIASLRLSSRPSMPSGLDQAQPRQVLILEHRPKLVRSQSSPHFNLPRQPSLLPRPMSLVGPFCQQRFLGRPNLHVTPYSGPMLKLTSSTSQKRKEAAPTSNQQFGPQNGGKMSKLSCEVCEVTCTSAHNLEMHLRGQKHKAKVKRMQEIEKGINVDSIEASDPMIKCELCGIWCMNQFSYQEHLNGKNHILKLYASRKESKVFG